VCGGVESLVFALLDEKNIEPMIWKMIRKEIT
jgi:hypothetical protein